MTLDELLDAFYTKIRESRTAGSFSTTEVTSWFNEIIEYVYNYHAWNFRQRERLVSNPFTTLSSSASIGDTDVSVASTAGFYIGSYVCINDGSNFDTVVVSNISGSDIYFSPALVNAYDSGDNVSCQTLFLPYDCSNKISITRMGSSGSIMLKEHQRKVDQLTPFNNTSGYPEWYYHIGKNFNTVPLSVCTYATTSTVGYIASTMPNTETNYYRDYKLTNLTRYKTAFVTAMSTGGGVSTLTMDRTISTQVATDVIRLTDNRDMINITPLPDASYSYSIKYYSNSPTVLVNLYDEPKLPEHWKNMLVNGAVALAKKREDMEFSSMCQESMMRYLLGYISQDSDESDSVFYMTTWGYDKYNEL